MNGEMNSTNQLDPWSVILSCLFEVDSYEIPGIIDAAGLNVDWHLTEKEGYSHKYRKGAFRPRVKKAYEALNENEKLRVIFIVCYELSKRKLMECLDIRLQRIGWHIENGSLIPANVTVREMFFPQGTQHDAFVHIRKIIHGAK